MLFNDGGGDDAHGRPSCRSCGVDLGLFSISACVDWMEAALEICGENAFDVPCTERTTIQWRPEKCSSSDDC